MSKGYLFDTGDEIIKRIDGPEITSSSDGKILGVVDGKITPIKNKVNVLYADLYVAWSENVLSAFVIEHYRNISDSTDYMTSIEIGDYIKEFDNCILIGSNFVSNIHVSRRSDGKARIDGTLIYIDTTKNALVFANVSNGTVIATYNNTDIKSASTVYSLS